MSGEPVGLACAEGNAECSALVVQVLHPSQWRWWGPHCSKAVSQMILDTPPSGSKHSSLLPPALRGQHSGLRGSRGVCQHPCENHISVSDALLHLLRGSAVPAWQARPVPPTAPHNHCWPRLQPQAALAPQVSLSQRGPSRGPEESQDPLWWLSHKAAVTLARCGLCVSEYRPGKRGGKVKRRQLENELKVWSRRGKTCSVPSHRH